MRLADYVANFFADKGVKVVFTVTGGGAMYLNDAFSKNQRFKYVAMHQEQTAAMAAEGYFRASNKLGVCQVTTGPGGTNAISGCAGAWADSEAVFFVSGQVESYTILGNGIRQYGIQEVDIVSLVKPITKIAVTLTDPLLIRYELERLYYHAQAGRKGPVWLDIPLDLQNFQLESVDGLIGYKPRVIDKRVEKNLPKKFNRLLSLLNNSSRPVICLGNGVRESFQKYKEIIEDFGIPIVSSWNGKDLLSWDSKNHIGSAGLFGDRASNFVIQNSDLIIGIGYRFSVGQIGYDPSMYAREATICSVDVDAAEFLKNESLIDLPINCDSENFLNFLCNTKVDKNKFSQWLEWGIHRKAEYNKNEVKSSVGFLDSFTFTDFLSRYLSKDSIVVTDMGTSFTCTHQFIKLPDKARLFTSSGLAAMGFGLPGAIGASFSVINKSPVLLITGDGGLMFNLQDLQTVATHNLKLGIIIYNNDGYLTMKHMQKARFSNLVGSNKETNIECPDFQKLSKAFEIPSLKINDHTKVDQTLIQFFKLLEKGPCILEVILDPWQELIPRVQTQSDSEGRLFPATLEDMYPLLKEEEFEKNMIIKPLKRPKL